MAEGETTAEGREVVGILGLGRMGRAMAQRLAGQGWTVLGWTRSGIGADAARGLGLTPCATPAEVAAGAGVILTSLIDDAAVRAVLATLVATDLSGRLLVETSTVAPDLLRGFAGEIAAAGGRALDAPVSGGPEMIAAGKAGLYLGGGEAEVARFRPVAQALSDRVVHVGPLGAGAAAKVVNNMVLAGYWQVVKEALQTGRAAGLPLAAMLAVLKDSPAATPALRGRIPVITGESAAVGFTVDGVVKDLGVFLSTADAGGIPTPAMRAALDSFRAASAAGAGEDDLGTMLRLALAGG